MDEYWMQKALCLAQQAQAQGEVPVGALIVKNNEIIAEGLNGSISCCDPTAHAEMQAIRAAAQTLQNYRMLDTTLYVTLEPCAMCAGAIIQARIARVIFGASDPRTGAAGSVFNVLENPVLNHRASVTKGILGAECGALLTQFFRNKRKNKTTSYPSYIG